VSYEDWDRDELREELDARGLSTDGDDEELRDRLAVDDEEAEDEVAEDEVAEDEADEATSDEGGEVAAPGPRAKPLQVARIAVGQLAELTGRRIDGMAGMEPVDGGWRILVDVVEVARVPPSTDVIGTYEVDADADGDLLRYERIARYVRGQARGEES